MKKIYVKPDIEIIETDPEMLCSASGEGIAWEDINNGSGSFNDDESETDALSKEHNSVWSEW